MEGTEKKKTGKYPQQKCPITGRSINLAILFFEDSHPEIKILEELKKVEDISPILKQKARIFFNERSWNAVDFIESCKDDNYTIHLKQLIYQT